jgi:hypothetical protein
MIRGQYFMPLLGVETSSDFSRVHQIREEDRKMPPLTAFASPTGTWLNWGGFRF